MLVFFTSSSLLCAESVCLIMLLPSLVQLKVVCADTYLHLALLIIKPADSSVSFCFSILYASDIQVRATAVYSL